MDFDAINITIGDSLVSLVRSNRVINKLGMRGLDISSDLNLTHAQLASQLSREMLPKIILAGQKINAATPAQRAFAFTIGMGLVDYTCKEEDMKKLASNEIKNKLFEDWSNIRGSSSNKNLGKPIYKKNILDLID